MIRARAAFGFLAASVLMCACASDPPPPAHSAGSPQGKAATTAATTAPAAEGTPVTIPATTLLPRGAGTPQNAPGTQTASPAKPPPPGSVEASRDENVANRTAVVNGVTAHHPAMRACYDEAARTNGALAGRVTIRFTVAPSGDVVTLANEGSTLPDGDVIKCVTNIFAKMKFPAFEGKAVTIIYPIDFAQNK